MKNKEIICALSSDSRELYKADIYKTLSMPENFILHFRYKYKYVDEKILNDDIEKLKEKKVVIFFVAKKDDDYEYISIRKANIHHIEKSDNTELVNIYLKLGEFTNTKININNNDILLKYITCNGEEKVSWKNRIEKVRNYFDKNVIYYFIENITDKKNRKISIKFNYNSKYSYYKLKQGKEYIINLAISNPFLAIGSKSENYLEVKTNNNDIILNRTLPIYSSVQFDNIQIPFFITYSNYYKITSHILFKPIINLKENNYNEYISDIKIEKVNGYIESVIFGLLSIFFLIGFFIIKDNSYSLSLFSLKLRLNIKLVIVIIIFFISTSVLFHKYNKK